MSNTLKRLAEAIQKSFLDTGQEATPAPPAGAEDIEEDEQQYNAEFRKTLVNLERLLHSTEEPAAITMESLKTVCRFHDADWAGILVLDRTA